MTDEATFEAPALEPFNSEPQCRACGLETGAGLYTWIQCRWRGISFAGCDVNYCRGSMEPTASKDFINPLAGLMGRDMKEQVEVTYRCYGLFKPHLHIRCRHCGFNWFMEVARP